MLAIVLSLHSLLRWAVLVAAAWATFAAIRGSGRVWTRRARLPGVALAALADTQLLLGLALWAGLSPYAITRGISSSWWSLVHPLLGVAVVALVHVGSVRVKRGLDDGARWRAAARFYGAALLVAVAATPWPFLAGGRPLLPF
jgi:cytochrome bd-type quinol oxidase subunit 2